MRLQYWQLQNNFDGAPGQTAPITTGRPGTFFRGQMKTREQWLRERKRFLTASDCAAVLGIEDSFNNILDVYMDKATDEVVEIDNLILRHGHHMEPFTADLYAEETGREVRNPGGTELLVHPDIPWLAATRDREVFIDGEWHPLEIKQVNDPNWIFHMDEWQQNPPQRVWVQSQIQGACQRSRLSCIVGQFPMCRLAIVDNETDAEFFEMAFPVLDRFWNHNVAKRIPPEVPRHPKALESVRRMYRPSSRFTTVLGHDELSLVEQFEQLKHEARESQAAADSIEAELRGQIGNAPWGALPDGSFLEVKEVHRKGYTVKPKTYTQIVRKRF